MVGCGKNKSVCRCAYLCLCCSLTPPSHTLRFWCLGSWRCVRAQT